MHHSYRTWQAVGMVQAPRFEDPLPTKATEPGTCRTPAILATPAFQTALSLSTSLPLRLQQSQRRSHWKVIIKFVPRRLTVPRVQQALLEVLDPSPMPESYQLQGWIILIPIQRVSRPRLGTRILRRRPCKPSLGSKWFHPYWHLLDLRVLPLWCHVVVSKKLLRRLVSSSTPFLGLLQTDSQRQSQGTPFG